MILINENIPFVIAATYSEISYSEDACATLNIQAIETKNTHKLDPVYVNIAIKFNTVAELNCRTVNFYEVNYNQFNIFLHDGSIASQYDIGSRLYQVKDSKELAIKKSIYDPKNALNLKHYLVAGNDCYYEVLAANYEISMI